MLFYLLVRLGLKKTPRDKLPPEIVGDKSRLHVTDQRNRRCQPHHINWDVMRSRQVTA